MLDKMLTLALFFCRHFSFQFFQKLEEKRIAEDAENKHLETRLQVSNYLTKHGLDTMIGKSLLLKLIVTQKVAY